MKSRTDKSCSATLRIASKAISVDDISTVMGVRPSESYDIGDVISKRSPTPTLRTESVWLFSSGVPDAQPLEDHIEELLAFSEQRAFNLKQLSSECDIEMFCTFSTFNGQGGFVLDKFAAQRVAKLGIDLVFDLYFLDDGV